MKQKALNYTTAVLAIVCVSCGVATFVVNPAFFIVFAAGFLAMCFINDYNKD